MALALQAVDGDFVPVTLVGDSDPDPIWKPLGRSGDMVLGWTGGDYLSNTGAWAVRLARAQIPRGHVQEISYDEGDLLWTYAIGGPPGVFYAGLSSSSVVRVFDDEDNKIQDADATTWLMSRVPGSGYRGS